MNINSFTASSIASSVWAAATRTITADPATSAGAATLVWALATRTLTANPATIANINGNGTLALSGLLDLRPASGKVRVVSFYLRDASNRMQPGTWDGVTLLGFADLTLINFLVESWGGPSVGLAIKNFDGASGHTYSYMGYDQTQ